MDEWLQLQFALPMTLNEFRIKEDPSSSVVRYVIECWNDKAGQWVGCFNGRTIGSDFMAPIVGCTTTKVRLLIKKTTNGTPCIAEFAAYNDTTSGPPDPPPSGPPPTGIVNDSHPHVRYRGQWETYSSATEIGGDEHYSNEKGASCQLAFSGSSVTWIGVKNLDNGEAEVYLDDQLQGTVDTYSDRRQSQQKLFQKSGLSPGVHTIKIIVKGTKQAASKDTHVVIDALDIRPGLAIP